MATPAQIQAKVSPSTGPGALHEYDVLVGGLSNTGISLSLDLDIHQRLQSESELIVSLNLPGQTKRYRIACLVRSRNEEAKTAVYSCEFDWSATMDPLAVVEDLLQYTMDEQIAS